MMRGEESAESLRELVLATRHLKRIADQLAEIPNELREFGERTDANQAVRR
jgi:phosphate uptake regulator